MVALLISTIEGPRALYATAAGSLFFLLALIRGLRIERRQRVRHAVLTRWRGRAARPAPLWVVRVVWVTALLLVSMGVALLYWGAWGTLYHT